MSNFNFIGNFLGKRANLKKDGHDLSSLETMSIPFGVQVPVTSVFCVPNEHYKCRFNGVTQTAEMREDNFAQIYSNQKAVFVPMSTICRDYLSMTEGSRSTRKDDLLPGIVTDARFDLRAVLSTAFAFYFVSRITEAFISVVPDFGKYSFDVNVQDFVDGDGNPMSAKFTSAVRASLDEVSLARIFYMNILTTLLRNPESYDMSHAVHGVRKLVSCSGTPIYMDVLRLLDSLGFGNFWPAFDLKFGQFVLDSGEYSLDTLFYIHPDVFFVEFYAFPPIFADDVNISSVSLFPLLAYQYYINLVERSNYRNPLTKLISWDSILNEHLHSNLHITLHGDTDSLTYEPFNSVPKFVDFLNTITNVCAHDNQFDWNFSELMDWEDNNFFFYLFSLNNPLLPSDVFTSSQLSVVSGSIPTTDISEVQSNLVKAYAETSALYKLRQDLLRAGVRRDKQMQSIFGVSGNQHVNEPVFILDDTSNEVNIVGLLNQAETAEAPLGARASRGNGKYGLNFRLDTEDFGFLFIVQSFTCSVFYENFMIDRSNLLSSKSWFMPQYNHLGLEPIRAINLSFLVTPNFTDDRHAISFDSSVIGFSARDWHLKQRVNKVHGAFTNYGMASPTKSQGHYADHYDLPAALSRGNSQFGGFVPTVIDQQTDHYDSYSSMYYNPNMANNLFVNMVDGGIYGSYGFDQFRNAFSIRLTKVSPMPKLGLFRLDV